MKPDNIIKNKSLDFAIRIVRLYKHISETSHEYVLSKQLLKSGTSIGANVREAIGGQSKEDFIAKMHIALKGKCMKPNIGWNCYTIPIT